MDTKYKDVMAANQKLHAKLSTVYNETEPHFRNENVGKVRKKLKGAATVGGNNKLLDLGCGTGFIIENAKDIFEFIVGIDITPEMVAQVKASEKVELYLCDTGTYVPEIDSFDVVTAYSFLHHLYDIKPTLNTAFNALKPGGIFYADLDPNFYFWNELSKLPTDGHFHETIAREVSMTLYKDEDIQRKYGIDKETFNNAEYGKNIKGGFIEEELVRLLLEIGFKKVDFFYHWFLGEGNIVNAKGFTKEENLMRASQVNDALTQMHPLSRHLFKYVGFYAHK